MYEKFYLPVSKYLIQAFIKNSITRSHTYGWKINIETWTFIRWRFNNYTYVFFWIQLLCVLNNDYHIIIGWYFLITMIYIDSAWKKNYNHWLSILCCEVLNNFLRDTAEWMDTSFRVKLINNYYDNYVLSLKLQNTNTVTYSLGLI